MAIQVRGVTVWLIILVLSGSPPTTPAQDQDTIRDRLWIWGHPAGVYNESYLKGVTRSSTIEPVAAADTMGIRNMIFIHYEGRPAAPFARYFVPFQKLDRVYWSLVGASGATTDEERRDVFELAESNDNIIGFILDDFFHESAAEQPQLWLAENNVEFPVTLTITSPLATSLASCDTLELVQSNWKSGDYRAKEFVIELAENGGDFVEVSRGTLPDQPAARVSVKIPPRDITAIQIRILSTHDLAGAMSCGLQSVELFSAGTKLNLEDWKATASSTYPGHDAASVIGRITPFRASLTPDQLRELAARQVRGTRLPIMAVVYTGQISARAKPHLDQVDQVCMWTWNPQDLSDLAANFTKLERLVAPKSIFLGCYMFDFANRRPLDVAQMQQQTELGFKWLRQGRIDGMIFLATPTVDVGLEAVEWTRNWIAKVGDEPLRANE